MRTVRQSNAVKKKMPRSLRAVATGKKDGKIVLKGHKSIREMLLRRLRREYSPLVSSRTLQVNESFPAYEVE